MSNGRRELIFITRKWPPAMGGMETYCLKLTEALRREHSVEVIALAGSPDGRPPRAHNLLIFGFTAGMRLLLHSRMPELIHVGDIASWPFAILAQIRRPSIRIAISAHGTDVSYGRRSGWRAALYRSYLRIGARLLRAAIVIANSQATADASAQAGFRRIEVVPLATDLHAPQGNIHECGSNLLFAGRLMRSKGLSWFVENVLPHLPRGIDLDVAGLAWEADEARCLDHPRVRYLGVLDQARLAEAYATARCVVVPNIELANGVFEGFGLVAAEAAAAGGVVLAANSAGLMSAEIDGETGFLLPPGAAQPWIDKVGEVVAWSAEERRTFVTASMRQAKHYYSWERVALQTIAIYPR
jgi:glycosyltransferase involved in cell wall biosynthesis